MALAGHVGWLLLPVARSDLALRRARATAGQIVPGPYEGQPAYANYLRAAEADPLDPTTRFEAASYLIGYAEASPTPQPALAKALDLITKAIELDPFSTQLRRQKVRMCHRAFTLTGDPQYLRSALAPARRITELYPQSPTAHADLGQALLAAGHLADAVNHLSVALNLDDARPEWEELRRLPTGRRDELQTQIAEASALLRAAGAMT